MVVKSTGWAEGQKANSERWGGDEKGFQSRIEHAREKLRIVKGVKLAAAGRAANNPLWYSIPRGEKG